MLFKYAFIRRLVMMTKNKYQVRGHGNGALAGVEPIFTNGGNYRFCAFSCTALGSVISAGTKEMLFYV